MHFFFLRYNSIGFLILQIVNSVVMDHATIGDGCTVQGSVICSNVQLQERATLKDCQVSHASTTLTYYMGQLELEFIITNLYCHSSIFQVGTGFVVTSGSEYKGESLAKKEK